MFDSFLSSLQISGHMDYEPKLTEVLKCVGLPVGGDGRLAATKSSSSLIPPLHAVPSSPGLAKQLSLDSGSSSDKR